MNSSLRISIGAACCLLAAGLAHATDPQARGTPMPQTPPAVTPSAAPARAAAAYTGSYKDDLFALCGEAMAGRAAGTDGGEHAIAWLEQQFAAIGLQPLDGSGFRQPFTAPDPVPATWAPSTECTLAIAGERRTLRLGEQWAPFPFSADGELAGEVVFAGHALVLPQLGIDDFRGLDVRGKIVVALRGGPRWREVDAPVRRAMPQLSFGSKAANCKQRGAIALLIVDRDDGERGLDVELVRQAVGAAELPMAFVDREHAAAWFADGTKGLVDAQRELDGGRAVAALQPARVELRVVMQRRPPITTANVLGWLPGTDANADRIVVGAHHDHIGTGEFASLAGAAGTGRVHPGADDNASGTAALLELARRWRARGPGKRGIVFAAFGAEELGQCGSRWFVEHLSAPGTVAAMLDMNMIGRGRSGKLAVYGVGTGDGLAALVQEHATARGLSIELRERSSWRADQSVFVRASVPALLFTTGLHEQYHRPTDVPELIEVDAAQRVVDLVDDLLKALVDGPRRPFQPPTKK